MPNNSRYALLELQAGNILYDGNAVGATADLNILDGRDIYIITGNATLSSSLTIQGAGTPSQASGNPDRPVYLLLYAANLTIGGNTLTIFGQSVPAQVAAGQVTLFVGFWDGSAWKASGITLSGGALMSASVALSKLATISGSRILGNNTGGASSPIELTAAQVWTLISTSVSLALDNIPNNLITNAKLAQVGARVLKGRADAVGTGDVQDLTASEGLRLLGANLFSVVVLVSFENGEQSNNEFCVPQDCRLERIDYSVIKTLAGTDDGTITARIATSLGGASSPVTDGQLIIPMGETSGSVGSVSPTGANVLSNGPDNFVSLVASKTTPGGKVLVTLIFDMA